jgi:hypothetical protein
VQSNISITPGFTATISPQLHLGQAQQTVEVSAAPPVVDTANNTTATTFELSRRHPA